MNRLKKNILSFTTCLILPVSLLSGQDQITSPSVTTPDDDCTSIMVGRAASADGSVITSHTCDAYYRTWLNIIPAADHQADEMHPVYWGTLHTRDVWSQNGMVKMGEIPEIKHTYAYINTAYPCLNEKQLAIGETTFGGKRDLRNKKGLFLIEELERIALERCTNAREAIRLIGDLIRNYGYGDYGECITIADTKEVWQMEITGEGPDKVGGVWAAQRIPDNHVGIAANIARIGIIDLKNKDYFMASENVFDVARKMGYWDGKQPFKFWKAYGNSRKPFSIREYFVLSTLAPSLDLDINSDELPFSVKPEKKVDIRDILAFYRSTYDGTEWEMIRNLKVPNTFRDKQDSLHTDTIISPAAHPWLSRDKRELLNSLKKGVVKRDRPIAVQYCAYSWIVQLREGMPDAIGGRLWFSFDIPRLSPRIPFYAGNLSVPESFLICGQDQFTTRSALWAFRRANRLAMVKWGEGKEIIEPEVKAFEDKAFDETMAVETKALALYNQDVENAKAGKETRLCNEYLTRYSNDFARAAINRWWELGDKLWVKFRWNF
ncbi:MAG: peptidase [Chlorobi bacterium]|nr:peptidase [Chlorobiota bacterium]